MGCYLDLGVVGVLEASSGVMITEKNFEDWTGDAEESNTADRDGHEPQWTFLCSRSRWEGQGRVRGEKRCWKSRTDQRQPGSSTTKLV